MQKKIDSKKAQKNTGKVLDTKITTKYYLSVNIFDQI